MSVKNRIIEGNQLEITQIYKAGVHNGIDVVNKNYTLGNIIAHTDGVVSEARDGLGNMKGSNSYGNYVKIKHDNGYSTLYAHLAKGTVKVAAGNKVSKGQVLGFMGDSGNSYGAHLHFEVRNESDGRIDPTPYLDADLPAKVVEEPKEEAGKVIYTVKAGDTLSEIGAKYGINYMKIARDNNIANPNLIYPGQKLIIDVEENEPIKYTVKAGDTLSEIGAKYGVNYMKIARDNNIANPNLIYVGQVLTINK